MVEVHRRAIRDVALALSDPELRSLVHDAIRSSPFREGKLHLRTFLEGEGASLLDAVVNVRNDTRTDVLASLDSIVDLEFYMPVPAHRQRWSGGSDVIVAGVLRDDGTIPIAFDLNGDSVPVESADDPPEIPALVLVPVETDFSAPAPAPARAQQSGGTPGAYLTFATTYDDYEGWPNGAPEFEIHVFVIRDGTFEDVTCVGEARSGDRFWNYDYDPGASVHEPFVGEVLLGTDSEIDTTATVEMQWWEDDTGPCDDFGGGLPPDASGSVWEAISELQAIAAEVLRPDTVPLIEKILESVPKAINALSSVQADDLVGIFSGPTQQCFEPSGPMGYDVIDPETFGANAHASIDWQYGEREPLCPDDPDPLPPGSVSIDVGQNRVPPNTWCHYQGSATGGTPPYTFSWYRFSTAVADGEAVNIYTESSDFELNLVATDVHGRSGSDTWNVTIDPEAMCLQ